MTEEAIEEADTVEAKVQAAIEMIGIIVTTVELHSRAKVAVTEDTTIDLLKSKLN